MPREGDRYLHRSQLNFKQTFAKSAEELVLARAGPLAKLERLERNVAGPFFAGTSFSLADAVFAPALRQLDLLEGGAATRLFASTPKVNAWRKADAEILKHAA